MDLETIRTNKAGTILRFAIPSIIAMILTSLITVADGFFIGNYVGAEGIAAVNLGLPIVYVFLGVGLMISVGGMAIAGMALGGGDIKTCKTVFNQTMGTALVFSASLSVIAYFCLDPLLRFNGADARVSAFFQDYYTIMLWELPLMIINASFGMFIRGEGQPQYFMKVNILNVLLNIVLNYLFVRYWGWGVQGVAAASLISAAVALIITLYFFLRKSKVYKLGLFRFSGEVLRNTLRNGSSEFVGEISLGISMFAYNYVILRDIGVDGVTAFTIVGYIAYVFSMVVIGFAQGASPLISFVYGAGERALAIALRKITSGMVLFAGALVFVVVVIGSGWYSGIFVRSEAVRALIASGIAVFSASFLFSGVNVIASIYFTSIGKALESAIVSCARGLVILLACIFVLPMLYGMMGIWMAAPVTEILTLFLSVGFIRRDSRAMIAEFR